MLGFPSVWLGPDAFHRKYMGFEPYSVKTMHLARALRAKPSISRRAQLGVFQEARLNKS